VTYPPIAAPFMSVRQCVVSYTAALGHSYVSIVELDIVWTSILCCIYLTRTISQPPYTHRATHLRVTRDERSVEGTQKVAALPLSFVSERRVALPRAAARHTGTPSVPPPRLPVRQPKHSRPPR